MDRLVINIWAHLEGFLMLLSATIEYVAVQAACLLKPKHVDSITGWYERQIDRIVTSLEKGD